MAAAIAWTLLASDTSRDYAALVNRDFETLRGGRGNVCAPAHLFREK